MHPAPSLPLRQLDEIWLAPGPSSVPSVEPASSLFLFVLGFPRCVCSLRASPMLSPASAAAELMRGCPFRLAHRARRCSVETSALLWLIRRLVDVLVVRFVLLLVAPTARFPAAERTHLARRALPDVQTVHAPSQGLIFVTSLPTCHIENVRTVPGRLLVTHREDAKRSPNLPVFLSLSLSLSLTPLLLAAAATKSASAASRFLVPFLFEENNFLSRLGRYSLGPLFLFSFFCFPFPIFDIFLFIFHFSQEKKCLLFFFLVFLSNMCIRL